MMYGIIMKSIALNCALNDINRICCKDWDQVRIDHLHNWLDGKFNTGCRHCCVTLDKLS
jgi:hypothetical protein